jgi:Arc/MetJ-type ribon-helix-helix transcriptional regulator
MQEHFIMRPGNTINLSITLPKAMAELVDRLCIEESRNRSELMREAFRTYLKTRTSVPGLAAPDDDRSKPVLSSFTEWASEADNVYDNLA